MLVRYFIKKIGYALLVLLGVVILVFILFQGFGDPARLIAGQSGDQKTMENIRKELYLDQPKWKQLLLHINDVSPISIHSREEIEQKKITGFFIGEKVQFGLKLPYLGRSYQSKKEVGSMLLDALPGTIVLASTAMILACMVGISLGIVAAVHKGSWLDHGSMIGSVAGISTPSFFMAILLAYYAGIVFHDYTGLQLTGSLYEIDDLTGEKKIALRNLVLPAITLGIRPMAIIAQLTRSSMLDVLGQDYIRTAYAKGLSKQRVILFHALPNAMNPVITAVTGWFAELLAGSFFIEYIFGWKGLGKITVDALEKLDYPVVMGSVLLSASIFVLVNLFSDFLYKWIDPRIGGRV